MQTENQTENQKNELQVESQNSQMQAETPQENVSAENEVLPAENTENILPAENAKNNFIETENENNDDFIDDERAENELLAGIQTNEQSAENPQFAQMESSVGDSGATVALTQALETPDDVESIVADVENSKNQGVENENVESFENLENFEDSTEKELESPEIVENESVENENAENESIENETESVENENAEKSDFDKRIDDELESDRKEIEKEKKETESQKETENETLKAWENEKAELEKENAENIDYAENDLNPNLQDDENDDDDVDDDEESKQQDYTEKPNLVESQRGKFFSVVREIRDIFSSGGGAGSLKAAKKALFAQASEGVRRLNKNPMYLIAFALFLFLVIMAYSAVQTTKNQMGGDKKDEVKSSSDTSSVYARQITKNYNSGGIIADKSFPQPPKSQGIIDAPKEQPQVNFQSNGNEQQVSIQEYLNGIRAEPLNPVVVLDDESAQIRAMRMRNLQTATSAPTTVQLSGTFAERNKERQERSRNGIGAMGANNVATQSMESQLLAMRQRENSEFGNTEQSFQNGMNRLNTLNSQQDFVSLKKISQNDNDGMLGGNNNSLMSAGNVATASPTSKDRWFLDSKIQNPRSDYELRAGSVIPATLITGINSELGGQILGQVAQNIYDTPTGDYLLIPQGTKLLGTYSSDVAYGQSRVLVAWQRLIFPDGKALDIGSMAGADSAGYAGFKDKVDNHYLRIFGSALLMSFITAGVTYSQDNLNSSGTNQRASDALSEALGQQLGSVASAMIQKNLNISPTLIIREGFRFNVVVSKDITFDKAYEPFDY